MTTIRVEVTDSELEIVTALQKHTPHYFSVGSWLMTRFYDAGFDHAQGPQHVWTQRDGNKTILVIEQ